MNFKVFLLIFALSIFLLKYPPICLSKYPLIFTDIFDIFLKNPSTDISVITDILFLDGLHHLSFLVSYSN